jgi:pimeloyl-ACP methyl ester carboxylesterase
MSEQLPATGKLGGHSTEVVIRGALQLFAFGCACSICFAVVTPVLVMGAILLCPFVRSRYRRKISEEVVADIETSLVQGKPYTVQQAWTTYRSKMAEHGGDWKIHSLIVKTASPKKRDLVFVHGYGGSCIAFLPAFDYLRKSFNVHAPDLPGFGRSSGPFPKAAGALENLDYICDFLHGYLQEHTISEVHLVGHSFGAYICVHFATRYPDLVSKLVLCDIAGTYPLQASGDAYLAMVYKFHPLHGLFQAAGGFGAFVCYTWFSYFGTRPAKYHLIQRNANRAGNLGASMFSSLVTLSPTECYGHKPCLSTILRLKVPVALVWGKKDPLIPLEQARVLTYLMGPDSRCFVVDDGSHSPVEINGEERGDRFANALELAFTGATQLPETAAKLAALIEENEERFLSFRGSFDVYATKDVIAAMYVWLRTLANKAAPSQATSSDADAQLVPVG